MFAAFKIIGTLLLACASVIAAIVESAHPLLFAFGKIRSLHRELIGKHVRAGVRGAFAHGPGSLIGWLWSRRRLPSRNLGGG